MDSIKSSLLSSGMIAAALTSVLYIAPTHLAGQSANLAGQSNSPSRSVADEIIKKAAAKPTPRTPDGHPDLNGSWASPELPVSAHQDSQGNFYIDAPAEKGGTAPNLTATLGEQLAHLVDPNPPPYKPELLVKVKELASDKVKNDPEFHCKPLGVPRAGPPRQIVQTPALTVFLYDAQEGPPGSYRLLPTDGRPHRGDVDPSYFGDSIGHWEGDTLVVDVTHFNDETWLAGIPGSQGASGYFHSEALHVVERYTRIGNTLRWEATVEDPNVLSKPWKMTPRTVLLTDNMLYEEPICEERESEHITDKY
jgi:hypothetical protein